MLGRRAKLTVLMNPMGEHEGRALFGRNAAAYDAARPPYPAWMFTLLTEEGALFPHATTLEVGAGNGLATRELVKVGVSPLTVLEPDERFGPLLRSVAEGAKDPVVIRHETFEDALFAPASFDLVVIATAFHWLNPQTRVEKLAQIVKPGGHVALLWNVFGDLTRPDPFHEATEELLGGLEASPSGAPDKLPFALDRAAREREFLRGGSFELALYAESHWPLVLNPEGVRALYEGFLSIARLPTDSREALLTALAHIAQTDFGGRVTRNMTTPLYLFRRT